MEDEKKLTEVEQELNNEIDAINHRLSQIDLSLNEDNDKEAKKPDQKSSSKLNERLKGEKKRLEQILELINAEIREYRNDANGDGYKLLKSAHENRREANRLINTRNRLDDQIEDFQENADEGIGNNKSDLEKERRQTDNTIQNLFSKYKKYGKLVETMVQGGYIHYPIKSDIDPINLSDEEFKKLMEDYNKEIKQLRSNLMRIKKDILRANLLGYTNLGKKLRNTEKIIENYKTECYGDLNTIFSTYTAEINSLGDKQKNSKLSQAEDNKLRLLQSRKEKLDGLLARNDSKNKHYGTYEDIPTLEEVLKNPRKRTSEGHESQKSGKQNSRTDGRKAHNRDVTNKRRDLNKREKEIRQRMAEILGIPVSDNIENEYEHNMRFQLDDYEVDEIQELRKELKSIKTGRAYNAGKNTTRRRTRPVEKERESTKNKRTLKKPAKKGRGTYKVDIGIISGFFLKLINALKKLFPKGFFGNMLEKAKEGLLASGTRVLALAEEGNASVKEAKNKIRANSIKRVKKLKAKKYSEATKKQKVPKAPRTKKTSKAKKTEKRGRTFLNPRNWSASMKKIKNRPSKPKMEKAKESAPSEKNKNDLTWLKEQVENPMPGDYLSYYLLKNHYDKLRKDLDEELNKKFNAEKDESKGTVLDRLADSIFLKMDIIEQIMKAEGIEEFFKDDEETIIYSRLLKNILDTAVAMKIDIQGKPVKKIWNSVLSLSRENVSDERDNPSSVEQTVEYEPPEIRDHSEYITAENIQLILEQKIDQNGDSAARLMHYIVHEQKNKLDRNLSSAETISQKNEKLEQIKREENILDTYSDNIIKSILAQRVLIRILELADEWGLKTDGREMKDILGDVFARYGTNCVSYTARGKNKGNEPKGKTSRRTRNRRSSDEEQL